MNHNICRVIWSPGSQAIPGCKLCLAFIMQHHVCASDSWSWSPLDVVQNMHMLWVHVLKSYDHGRMKQVPVDCKVEPHVITAGQAAWRTWACLQQCCFLLSGQGCILWQEDKPLQRIHSPQTRNKGKCSPQKSSQNINTQRNKHAERVATVFKQCKKGSQNQHHNSHEHKAQQCSELSCYTWCAISAAAVCQPGGAGLAAGYWYSAGTLTKVNRVLTGCGQWGTAAMQSNTTGCQAMHSPMSQSVIQYVLLQVIHYGLRRC